MPIGGDPGISDGWPPPWRTSYQWTGPKRRPSYRQRLKPISQFRHSRIDYSTAGSGRPYVARR